MNSVFSIYSEEASVIGAANYFSGENYQSIGVVSQPADVIIVPFQVIEEHFDLLSKEHLKGYIRYYPSHEAVKQMYQQSQKWRQFKKDLFQAKLYETRAMKKKNAESREVAVKLTKLPEDIVAYISNKPKPIFMTKKKLLTIKKAAPQEAISNTETEIKELLARLDYESSGTKQSSAASIEMLQTAVNLIKKRNTLILDDRPSKESSKHLSLP